MPRPKSRITGTPPIPYRDTAEALAEVKDTAKRLGIPRSELLRRRNAYVRALGNVLTSVPVHFDSRDEPDALPPAGQEGERWLASDGLYVHRDGDWQKVA